MGASDTAIQISPAEARRIDAGAWRSESRCKKYPTHWWFAGGAHETVLARGICGGCPVQDSCLEFALGRPDLLGVWASTTPNERAAIRRARRGVADGVPAEVDLPTEEFEPVGGVDGAFFAAPLAVLPSRRGAEPGSTSARFAESAPDPEAERAREPSRRPGRGRPAGFAARGELDELFTPAEAARRLGVTPNTVTRWSRAGKISAIQTMGGHRRFRREEIDRILREASLVGPGLGRGATGSEAAPAPGARESGITSPGW